MFFEPKQFGRRCKEESSKRRFDVYLELSGKETESDRYYGWSNRHAAGQETLTGLPPCRRAITGADMLPFHEDLLKRDRSLANTWKTVPADKDGASFVVMTREESA